MKKNIDYEQLYYDSLYEIRKKDEEIKYLKNEINENVKTKINILKDNICNKIKNTKGNLSKDKIIDIIHKEAE